MLERYQPKNASASEKARQYDKLLSDVPKTVNFLAQAFTTPESVFNSPKIIDEHAFHQFYRIPVSALETRLERLGFHRVEDLVDMARCQAKGVEYISRDQYRSCKSPEELENLLRSRAMALTLSGFFLLPTTRKPKEVSRIFSENYDISPPEINKIIKKNGWPGSAAKLELKIAHKITEKFYRTSQG